MICYLALLVTGFPEHVGIPTPPPIATASHKMYAEAGQTYDYSDDSKGPVPYRIGADGPYTHYIDPSHPNATNSGNPHGTEATPRTSLPSYHLDLPPGSVVQIENSITGGVVLKGGGTAAKPVFIRGGRRRPTHSSVGGWFVECGHIVIENIIFDWRDGKNERINLKRKGYKGGEPITDVCIRRCEFFNGWSIPTSAYQCIRAKNSDDSSQIKNVVLWANVFRDMAVGRSDSVKNDVVAISLDANSSYFWIIDNRFKNVNGDGVQIACDSYVQGTTDAPHHVFFAGNVGHGFKENLIDLKNCHDVILSHNECYESGGYGYRFGHQDVLTGIARSNIWCIYNKLHHSNIGDGGFAIWELDGRPPAKQVYFIGNVAYDNYYDERNETGISFFSINSETTFLNNVSVGGGTGYYLYGDQQSDTYSGVVVNNVSIGAADHTLWIGGSPATLQAFEIANNAWSAGAKVRTYDGTNNTAVYNTLSDFAFVFPSHAEGSTDADVGVSVSAAGDIVFTDLSSARGTGATKAWDAAADAFESRYPTAPSFRDYKRGRINIGAEKK